MPEPPYGRPARFLARCDRIVDALLETLRSEVAQTGATAPEQVAYMGEVLPVLCARYAKVLPPVERERFFALVRSIADAP